MENRLKKPCHVFFENAVGFKFRFASIANSVDSYSLTVNYDEIFSCR